MVRQELDQFRHQCGFHLSEVLLKSEEVWVSRRTRWWAILYTAFVGPVLLQTFVHSMHPTVPRQVLSSPMVLSAEALSQLELTGEELARFLRFEPQLTKMLLRRDSLVLRRCIHGEVKRLVASAFAGAVVSVMRPCPEGCSVSSFPSLARVMVSYLTNLAFDTRIPWKLAF